jgi:hypothetical protein
MKKKEFNYEGYVINNPLMKEYISDEAFDTMSNDELDATEASGDLNPSDAPMGPNEDEEMGVGQMGVWGAYHNILEFMRDEIKRSELSEVEVVQLRTKLSEFFA